MDSTVAFVDQAADGHGNDPESSSSLDQSPAQGSLRHLLHGRDQCSDALGANTINSICAPSNTECYNCYTDQPFEAACDEPSSVLCTNPSPGAQKVCCPPLTSCAGQQEKSKVRCQITYPNLMAVAYSGTPSSSSSKTSSSATGSSTPTITTASSTAATASATPMVKTGDGETAAATTQEQPSQAMSGGAIAGVTVGIIVFLLLAGAVTRYLKRRRQRV
ncbi:hypothetical protein PG996_003357 [Apiospora saccharicola]|uniref:Uncharacterized protein n=1 Tax=Apiospora saccharicola TaxID=335842 RepID=A0ABR1W124_9PEZI